MPNFKHLYLVSELGPISTSCVYIYIINGMHIAGGHACDSTKLHVVLQFFCAYSSRSHCVYIGLSWMLY